MPAPLTSFVVPSKHRRDLVTGAAICTAVALIGIAAAWVVDLPACPNTPPVSDLSELKWRSGASAFAVAFASLLFGLCLLDVRSFLWHELTLTDDLLVWRKPGKESVIDVRSVERVRWRPMAHRSDLLLTMPQGRHRVLIGMFSPDDRQALIRWLRSRWPTSIQENWPRFCREYATPALRARRPKPLDPVVAAAERLRMRRTWNAIYVLSVAAAACVGWLSWRLTGDFRKLVLPAATAVIFFPIWFLCRRLPPASRERRSSPPGQVPFAAAIAIGLILFAAIPTTMAMYEISTGQRAWKPPVAVLFVPILPLLIVAFRYRGAHRTWQERIETEAALEWDRLIADGAFDAPGTS